VKAKTAPDRVTHANRVFHIGATAMTKPWKSDAELFALARQELFTAVVGDVMDKMGIQHQFLPPQIRPLHREMVVIGPALTVLSADVPTTSQAGHNEVLRKRFGLMLEALDDLKAFEVYLVSGASANYALWGELMSTRAKQLGASGAVINGYSRDTRGILACAFPTFSWGPYAQDQAPRGTVIDFRVSLNIEGTRIEPGDIVFGDVDGVCIIPALAREDVFRQALEKVRSENQVRSALRAGMPAVEAFKQYGIL
jgi:regulator of RNase E activity RraA